MFPELGRAGRIHRLGQTEVEHLHRAVVADLHIRRLEISMDDALLVRGLERRRDLQRDRHRVGKSDRAARDVRGQILPLDELHDECDDSVALLEAVDVRDVRMVQRRQRPGFAVEARAPVGVEGEGLGQDLDRDVPTQFRVRCAIDLAHTAGAERRADCVRTEARARGKCHEGRREYTSRPIRTAFSIVASTSSLPV